MFFGVSSSPFLLNETFKHHIELYRQENPEFVDMFLKSIYVDYLSSGATDEDGVYEVYTKLILRFAEHFTQIHNQLRYLISLTPSRP